MNRPLALVSPVPPDASGIADYTWDLAVAIAEHARVDLYYERPPSVEPVNGMRMRPVEELGWHVAAGDRTPPLYVIGNSEHHLRTWLALAHCGGDVLLHDVWLLDLYRELVRAGLTVFTSLESLVWAVDGDLLPQRLRERRPRPLDKREGMLYGVTLVKDVVDRARRVLVHSPAARDMIVRVRPERAADIRVVPYAIPARPHLDGMRDEPLVATFGFVKHGRLFIEAAARVAAQLPDARFMFAGRVQEPHVESRLTALIRARGLEDRFLVHHGRQIGPWLPDQLYYRLLSRTMVAVQLREYFYGETSGSTRRDCLSAGIPTIVNRVGTQAELPESVVLHVSPRPSPDEVANAVIRLLRDRSLRKALSRAALRFAADHTFAKEAKAVLAAVTD